MLGIQVRSLRRRRRLGIAFAVCLALCLARAAAAGPRIVAVGDVHGDLAAFKEILVASGVLDASGAWVGGETVLVQIGDLIDRGPSMRGTLDFVMKLEGEAARHGGRVVALLGNHEVMNMTGDLRYVAAANYAEFADAGSEKRRAEAWLQVLDLRQRRARELGKPEPPSGPEAREAWLEKHPPGFLEHQEAFGPGGIYGRWLRSKPACFAGQGAGFLHGGISPALDGTSLEEINRRVHGDLAAFDADIKLFVARGLILPFYDFPETMAAVREELQALTASETEARAAAERAGQPYASSPADAERREVYQHFVDWGSWTMNSPEGPLWFRGYGQWSDAEGDAEMPRLLAAAGVEHFVVGHTPQVEAGIRVRFGGAVFLIDTGMLDATFFPGGRASALEMADGVVSAISPGGPRRVIWRSAREKAAAAVFSEKGLKRGGAAQ